MAASARRAAKPTRVRLQIFGILWVLVLLNFIDRSALGIALPFIGEEFELTPEIEGWVLGSFFWTYLLLQIPGGWLLDKIGPRKVIGLAGAVWGAFQLFGGLVTNGILLTVSRLGLGASEAPVFPAGSKLNSTWLPAKERARGATFIDMAAPFGSAIGGLIVTWIIGVTGGWRWAFILTGALTIIVAVLYYLYLRDSPAEHPAVNQAEAELIAADQDVADVEVAKTGLPRILDYVRSSSFWGMWLGRLGWATVWWGIISWTPTYLDRAMGFDLAGLGWGTFLVYGMGVLGQIVAGWATDTFRAKTTNYNLAMKIILGISGVGSVAALLFLPAISSGYVALVLLGLAVFFNQFGGLYWAIPSWLAPKQQVGIVGSVMNVASSLGGAIAPVVMGYAIAAAGGGFEGAFVFLTISAALYLAGSMTINFNRALAKRREVAVA